MKKQRYHTNYKGQLSDNSTVIYILYTEITMAKEHMDSEEWEDYLGRRKELEDTIGVQWIRRESV